MDKIEIKGGFPLIGDITISGSKNASLPIIVSSLLTGNKLTLKNVPNLTDVISMLELLKSLNSEIQFNNNTLQITNSEPKRKIAPYDLVRKMRASFLVIGPLLARYGHAEVSLPGGCAIGARPVNIHLDAFQKMGANFKVENGYVKGTVKDKLIGTKINLPFSSVGATENILMAACLADGETIISNAAREPEIENLGNCLIKMGANISGLGTNVIKIQGKYKLSGCTFEIMPDRIEIGTFVLAVLGCSGKINLRFADNLIKENLKKIFGFTKSLKIMDKNNGVEVVSNFGEYNGVDLKTKPYPGFPTDLQAQLSAVMTKAKGSSTIEETIFENRFMHIAELSRMGAKINVDGSKVKIIGKKKLHGAEVMATDLRASSCLIIAGLMAEGKTIINRVYHLDRGYEKIEEKLLKCNAKIKRVKSL